MFRNSFSQFHISENHENELFVLCRDLKDKRPRNSPWNPFFVQNQCSDSSEDMFNVFEISEISVHEVGINKDAGDVSITSLDDDEQMCLEESSPKTTAVLDQVLEDELLKLKEILLNIKKDYPPHQCCPEVGVFNCISPCQVPSVCEVLELSALSEVAIAVVLNSLSLLEPAISLITAASIIHHAIYSRMKNWTSVTSRSLTTGILMFAKKYPKAVIDELLVPCLKDESFDTSQTDILRDIIKSGLPDDQVLYCLRESIEISSPSENTFTAICCIMERKCLLDASLCHSVIEKIYNWSMAFNSSIKFSKLLKSFISIYGSQMTEEQLSTLNIVVKSNNTFSKKSMENLIKKLSEKHKSPCAMYQLL